MEQETPHFNPYKYHESQVARLDSLSTIGDKSLGNIILVIGTGSFVLSLTYLTGIKSDVQDLHLVWLLIASWGLLILSILALASKYIFISLRATQAGKLLNEWGSNGYQGEHGLLTDKRINSFSTATAVCTYLSLALMVLGILALFVFVSTNLLDKTSKHTESFQQFSSESRF